MSEADKKSEDKPERALFVEWTMPPRDRPLVPGPRPDGEEARDRHVLSTEGTVRALGTLADVDLFVGLSESRVKRAISSTGVIGDLVWPSGMSEAGRCLMPRGDFDLFGIGEGCKFWFDIFQRDGEMLGRVRAPDPVTAVGPNIFDRVEAQ